MTAQRGAIPRRVTNQNRNRMTLEFKSRETKVTLDLSTQYVTILDIPTGDVEKKFVSDKAAAISYWTKYTNEEIARGR